MKVNNIINNLDVSMTNLKPFENSLALRFQEASKYDQIRRTRVQVHTARGWRSKSKHFINM